MNPQATYIALVSLTGTARSVGGVLEPAIAVIAGVVAFIALLPPAERYRRAALYVLAGTLVAGECVLLWFHWRLAGVMAVADPATGVLTGHVLAAPWIESEMLFIWALLVALMGVFMRRHRDELLRGVTLSAAVLTFCAMLLGRPLTNPLPSLVGQYTSYIQAMMSTSAQAAGDAFQSMEGARQYYYNAWFMWVHPALLFLSYAAFVISFLATLAMIRERHSAYETTAYRWARLGYLALSAGMILGLPWALMSWQGEAWWWSGKINMSIMMWMLYTAYLHARLYLRTRGMWKMVASLAILSFAILLLTYLATYVVPGAHSYAAADTGRALASAASALTRRGGLA
jgi:ABC-type transport system involved in cytochrome c biogenesis permease subunit